MSLNMQSKMNLAARQVEIPSGSTDKVREDDHSSQSMHSDVGHETMITRSLVTHFRVDGHSAPSKKTLLGVSRALLVLAFLAMAMTPCSAASAMRILGSIKNGVTSGVSRPFKSKSIDKKKNEKLFGIFDVSKIFGKGSKMTVIKSILNSWTFWAAIIFLTVGLIAMFIGHTEHHEEGNKYIENIFADDGATRYLRVAAIVPSFAFVVGALCIGGLRMSRLHTAINEDNEEFANSSKFVIPSGNMCFILWFGMMVVAALAITVCNSGAEAIKGIVENSLNTQLYYAIGGLALTGVIGGGISLFVYAKNKHDLARPGGLGRMPTTKDVYDNAGGEPSRSSDADTIDCLGHSGCQNCTTPKEGCPRFISKVRRRLLRAMRL